MDKFKLVPDSFYDLIYNIELRYRLSYSIENTNKELAEFKVEKEKSDYPYLLGRPKTNLSKIYFSVCVREIGLIYTLRVTC